MGSVSFGRKVRFRASHHYELKHLSKAENVRMFGEVNQVHWHDWELTLWISGAVAKDTGMLLDLVALDELLDREILGPFSNKHINQVDAFFEENLPTTEVLAQYFAERLIPHLDDLRLERLRVAESEDLFAEWTA